uniref:BHLH domain-containing protein n=1 Tax=Mycena chlorophos TaxID=658473 RepID=A0ABQ0LEM2_MYCCL|nr:predicted protein [Mycena chlorophos]
MHKLGAVLGETPFLVSRDDPDSIPPLPSFAPRTPTSPSHGRSFSVATPGPRTKLYTPMPRGSSLRRAASTKSHHGERPMLVIDVPHPDSVASGLTSLSPDPSSPLTPTTTDNISSSDEAANSDAARRRKLAKLARTLGENVPPSLVFPDHKDKEAERTVKGRRRASTLTSQVPDVVADWNVNAAAVAATTVRVSPTPSARPSIDSSRSAHSSHSSSTAHGSQTTHSSGEYLVVPRENVATNTHRSEKGWSGEWGGNLSMDEVVKGLRGLKMK